MTGGVRLVMHGKQGSGKGTQCTRLGEIVPDQLMIEIVADRIKRRDTRERGFLLDGFPRTVGQAQSLELLLGPRGVDLVLDLDVPTDAVLERIAARRICGD